MASVGDSLRRDGLQWRAVATAVATPGFIAALCRPMPLNAVSEAGVRLWALASLRENARFSGCF
jgi:hypothetical protein